MSIAYKLNDFVIIKSGTDEERVVQITDVIRVFEAQDNNHKPLEFNLGNREIVNVQRVSHLENAFTYKNKQEGRTYYLKEGETQYQLFQREKFVKQSELTALSEEIEVHIRPLQKNLSLLNAFMTDEVRTKNIAFVQNLVDDEALKQQKEDSMRMKAFLHQYIGTHDRELKQIFKTNLAISNEKILYTLGNGNGDTTLEINHRITGKTLKLFVESYKPDENGRALTSGEELSLTEEDKNKEIMNKLIRSLVAQYYSPDRLLRL